MTIKEMANGTIVVPPVDGTASWLLGHLFDTRARADETRGTYSLTEVTVAPAPVPGAPPHIHNAEDEAIYVLNGLVDVQIGDEMLVGEPGAFVFIPRGTVHAFSNPTSAPSRFLFIISPPGFEGFFEEAGEPASQRTLPGPPGGPPDLERLVALGDNYHMEILPPQ